MNPDDSAESLPISAALVGRRVANPARPDWGVGVVRKVEPTRHEGRAVQRVTVDFPVCGAKAMLVPPARLIEPPAEVTRAQGWIEGLAGTTTDDRLRKLPESVSQMFGTPRERLRAVARLYVYGDEPGQLVKWARAQTGAADPLALWSRDELTLAFQSFCRERDDFLRALAATLVQKEGRPAWDEFLRGVEQPLQARMRAVLGRIL